jgi:hypothetical protein
VRSAEQADLACRRSGRRTRPLAEPSTGTPAVRSFSPRPDRPGGCPSTPRAACRPHVWRLTLPIRTHSIGLRSGTCFNVRERGQPCRPGPVGPSASAPRPHYSPVRLRLCWSPPLSVPARWTCGVSPLLLRCLLAFIRADPCRSVAISGSPVVVSFAVAVAAPLCLWSCPSALGRIGGDPWRSVVHPSPSVLSLPRSFAFAVNLRESAKSVDRVVVCRRAFAKRTQFVTSPSPSTRYRRHPQPAFCRLSAAAPSSQAPLGQPCELNTTGRRPQRRRDCETNPMGTQHPLTTTYNAPLPAGSRASPGAASDEDAPHPGELLPRPALTAVGLRPHTRLRNEPNWRRARRHPERGHPADRGISAIRPREAVRPQEALRGTNPIGAEHGAIPSEAIGPTEGSRPSAQVKLSGRRRRAAERTESVTSLSSSTRYGDPRRPRSAVCRRRPRTAWGRLRNKPNRRTVPRDNRTQRPSGASSLTTQ